MWCLLRKDGWCVEYGTFLGRSAFLVGIGCATWQRSFERCACGGSGLRPLYPFLDFGDVSNASCDMRMLSLSGGGRGECTFLCRGRVEFCRFFVDSCRRSRGRRSSGIVGGRDW